MTISQEKGKISALHFMFGLTCNIQASALITTFYSDITRQETWFVVIIAYIVFLPTLLILFKLIDLFPGKNLIEINDTVFGPVIGKTLSLAYIFFFITLASLNLLVEQDFVSSFVLPETPKIVGSLMFIITCALAIRGGIQVIFRNSVLFFTLAAFSIISATLLSINNMKISNLFPLFSLPIIKYIQVTHIVSVYQFIELNFYLMFVPFVNEPEKIKKSFFYGILIGAIFLLIIMLRDTAVLGEVLPIVSFPSFQTLRTINVGEVFNRMEIFFAIVLVILSFFKISVLYYAVSLGISQIFNLKSFKNIVIIIGIIIVSYSTVLFQSSIDFLEYAKSANIFIHTIPEIIFPLITLMVATIRKASSSRKESSI